MVHSDWAPLEIHTNEGGLALKTSIKRSYSAALYQANLPIAGPLVACNQASRPSGPGTARLEIEALGIQWQYEIPALSGGEQVTIAPADDWIDQDDLERIVSPRRVSATLSFEDREARAQTWLLSTWQWPLARTARPALAAFVMPNDGLVRRVNASLPPLVRSRAKQPSAGHVDAGHSDAGHSTVSPPIWSLRTRVHLWIRSLFEHMQAAFTLSYAEALPAELPPGERYQPLRPPHRLLSFGDRPSGEGTCIDLTLFLASCTEGAGFAPLVLLLGPHESSVSHALLGIWLSGGTPLRPLLRSKDTLAHECDQKRLLLLETTALCHGDRGRDFSEALRLGRTQLDIYPHVEAVDIRALRPPRGRVLPIETPMEPAVLQALATAAQTARETGTPIFETLHLLFGLLRARGCISTKLLSVVGRDGLRIEASILDELRLRRSPGRHGQTIGYDRCLADAREAARSQGSTVVRECDLWWAILWGRSKAVKKVLQKASLSWSDVELALLGLCPQERLHTQMEEAPSQESGPGIS